MADYGLLQGLAGGLKEGLIMYQTTKNLKNEQLRAEKQQQRDQFKQMAELRAAGFALPEGTTAQNVYDLDASKLKYDPQYIDMKINADPYGIKGLQAGKLKKELDATPLTPGQEAADKEFGKSYVDWTSSGRADYEKSKAALGDAINALESDPELTGGTTGLIPDAALPFVKEKSAAVEQQVKSSILATMKALGANPTDRDLQEMYKSVWDKRLSPKENAAKIRAQLQKLDAQAAAKERAGEFFEKSGTLKGYQANKGLLKAPPKDSVEISEEDKQAVEWAKKNKSDPRAQEILRMHGM